MNLLSDAWTWFRSGLRRRAQSARNADAAAENRRKFLEAEAEIIANLPVPKPEQSRHVTRAFADSTFRKIKEADFTPQTKRMLVESFLREALPIDPDWVDMNHRRSIRTTLCRWY